MFHIKFVVVATIFTLGWRYCHANLLFGGRQTNCPENLVYQTCGSDCNKTCENYKIGTCNRKCVEKCGCPESKPLLHNGRCITKYECPKRGQAAATKPKEDSKTNTLDKLLCPETQVYQLCGRKCNRTCDHGPTGRPTCIRVCEPRCGCPPERSYWHNGKCVSYDKCSDTEDTNEPSDDSDTDSKVAEKVKNEFVESTYLQILKFFGLN